MIQVCKRKTAKKKHGSERSSKRGGLKALSHWEQVFSIRYPTLLTG